MPDYAHVHHPPEESSRVRAASTSVGVTPDALEKAPSRTVSSPSKAEDDPYDRFTTRRKRLITFCVAYSALLAPFASTSFLPSIPEIATDLSTSASTIDYTVCIYLVILALAPLVWAPYASYYGRQPIYLLSLPLYTIGSVGVAVSDSLVALILTRILQAFGASSVLSVGAGTIGDIYRPTERGTAMAWFYSLALLGPAFSPVVGGLLTEYTHGRWGGWRAMQWTLAGMGVLAIVLVVAFLPETAWTRESLKSAPPRPGSRRLLPFRWVWLDPIRPIWLLRYPPILLMSINSSLTLGTTYALLVPLSYTLGPRFHISNSALLGTFYLAPGLGNLVGARVAGRWSDRTVVRWIEKRHGDRVPEDRLRCAVWGGGAVLPVSILLTGAMTQYVDGGTGLALALVFLAVSGFGLMTILTPVNVRPYPHFPSPSLTSLTPQTYCVDVMQDRSAEVIAVNNVRSFPPSATLSC